MQNGLVVRLLALLPGAVQVRSGWKVPTLLQGWGEELPRQTSLSLPPCSALAAEMRCKDVSPGKLSRSALKKV